MNIVVAFLILLGVLFWFVVLGCVFMIWRYVRLKKEKGFYQPIGDATRSADVTEKLSSFDFPLSVRSARAQQPFMKYELRMTDVTVTAPSDDEMDNYNYTTLSKKRARLKKIPTFDESEYGVSSLDSSRRSSINALSVKSMSLSHDHPDENNSPQLHKRSASLQSLSGIESKRRNVSETMWMVLSKQEKGHSPLLQRRSMSLDQRYLSLQESVGSCDNSDGSSYISGDDYYDSTLVGGPKKKLAQRRSSEQARYSYRKSGNITFSTEYDDEKQIFYVHIIKVNGLGQKRAANEINPFVRLYLEPGKQQKQNTKYQKKSKDAFINQKMKFIEISKENFARNKLKLKVYSHGKLKRHELLGEVDVALSSINPAEKERFNVDLFVKRATPTSATVHISLCHQATFSKLEVIVQEAKNLPKRNVATVLNPYCSVCLFKQDNIDKKETNTKRNTRDPEFNEALDFDVTTDSATPLSTYSLAITLNNYNVIGKDETLGHVIFSLSSPQREAAEFWKSVQDSPHKRHFGYFALIDPEEI